MHKNNAPRVLIGIVTYNGEVYIQKCLESIRTVYDVEVAVWDNHSQDQTLALIDSRFLNVTLFKSKENLGFGQANNNLLRYAVEHEFDYVYLMNQDTYFVKGALNDLINTAQKGDNNCIYSPVHLQSNGVDLDPLFEKYIKNEKMDSGCYKFINAAAWLMPIDVVKKIGGFSPIFYHYGEDRDFANRLIYFGGYFKVCDMAFVIHDREVISLKNVFYDNPKKYIKRMNIFYICLLSNLNSSIIKAIYIFFVKCSIEFLRLLSLFKFKLALNFLFSSISILFNFYAILQHRKESKTRMPFL